MQSINMYGKNYVWTVVSINQFEFCCTKKEKLSLVFR